MSKQLFLPKFTSRLWEPVDIAFLAFFRMGFGLIMGWEVWRYFNKGWIGRYWVEPDFFFTYLGFGWVKPWPGNGMYIHFAVLGVLALCIMLGIQYRISAVLFWLGFTYVFLLDQTHYLNHFYLISLISFLLIWLPAHRASSLDAHFDPDLLAETAPRWTLWLLRFQVGIAYFYGGIAKLNSDWLHGDPMRMWLAARTDFPFIGQFFTEEWLVYLFSYGGLLLDLFAVPLLLWKRTRYATFAVVVLFHLTNNRLFTIGIFPFFMIAATTVFFDPDWPKRLFGWRGSVPKTTQTTKLSPRVAGMLGVFVVWQLLMPLRHYLYPSNVHWSEEGHRFAWHMKLRDKDASAELYVVTPDGTTQIELDDYLTSRQQGKMAGRPDMLIQFAHHLAAEYGEEAAVHAQVQVSLNGRAERSFVDSSVDLARVERGIRPKTWLLP